MRMSLKATKYVRGMNGRARGRKKRYTKFVTYSQSKVAVGISVDLSGISGRQNSV